MLPTRNTIRAALVSVLTLVPFKSEKLAWRKNMSISETTRNGEADPEFMPEKRIIALRLTCTPPSVAGRWMTMYGGAGAISCAITESVVGLVHPAVQGRQDDLLGLVG